jgi:hypothetical protein
VQESLRHATFQVTMDTHTGYTWKLSARHKPKSFNKSLTGSHQIPQDPYWSLEAAEL